MFDRGSHSVLVVDDNPAARYAIARGLRSRGYRTVEAGSGAEALELAEFVSGVVLDVHLPDVNGFEVCRLLRARPPTRAVQIVHVSAIAVTPLDEQYGFDVGANAFIIAPVDGEELAATLDRLLATADPAAGRSGSGAQSVLDQMTRHERLREPSNDPPPRPRPRR